MNFTFCFIYITIYWFWNVCKLYVNSFNYFYLRHIFPFGWISQ